MKIAVMQPYLFPYIGYFQMIKAVDKFIFYDDVNFIKQGWINRNKILVNKKEFLFTVPLQKANSFCLIKDTLINEKLYDGWKIKFQQTINQNYKKAPYFDVIVNLIHQVLDQGCKTISELAIISTVVISKYLKLETEFIISSEKYHNQEFDRLERLLDICKIENATQYINAVGGQELYKKEDFLAEEIKLNFIKSNFIQYKQFENDFVPWLSVIDVLMFNSVSDIHVMLDKYNLC